MYSLKMRASRTVAQRTEHVSGAEKILHESELEEQLQSLLQRALHHAKGKADFVNLKVEKIAPDALEYIAALPVSTLEPATAEDGQQMILDCLAEMGITNGRQIMEMFKDTYGMRGAMLLDVDTLERFEPDHARGIRATYMDAEHSLGRSVSDCKDHFTEAVVLASKVLHAPHIVAEICVSDDPDYVVGYVATHEKGYVRITKLKEMGCPDGGRIFLYRGPREDVPECIRYLQEQRVLVCHVPDAPDGTVSTVEPWTCYEQILEQKKAANIYRTTQEISTVQSAHVVMNGRVMLMLASNSYLDLINHPDVKAAAEQAIAQYGTGSGGSRLTTGTLPLHSRLEHHLAAFKGTEAALLFNTGYMANVGILSAMGIKGSVLFSDERNHASIIDGCRLSHARTVIYRHNDMADLEEKLRQYTPCQGLIVTDAVFSMDGDIAKLPPILSLAKKYRVLTMVDEAHATGVIGAGGRGICEYYGLDQQPDILMGTLSKSLASEGGYVCGSQLLIDYLRNTARSYIFSTSLVPASLAAADKALELLEQEPMLVKRLQENVKIFCRGLRDHGIDVDSETAIIPIFLHNEKYAVDVAEKLKDEGILLSAIRYPTVARNEARLRVALMAEHTAEELVQAAAKIAKTIKECPEEAYHVSK